jgi:hypothetical protein
MSLCVEYTLGLVHDIGIIDVLHRIMHQLNIILCKIMSQQISMQF